MMQVGVRDLKARLSEHLGRVKAGETLVVTERGIPVAKLTPLEPLEIPISVQQLLDSGAASWSGETLPTFDPVLPLSHEPA